MIGYFAVLAEDGHCPIAWMRNAVSLKWWKWMSVPGPRGHTSPWHTWMCWQPLPCSLKGLVGQPWCKNWQNISPCSQLIWSLVRGPSEWIILRHQIWSVGQKLHKFLYRRKMCMHLVRDLELLEMSLWHPRLGWHCFAISLDLWGLLPCRKQGTAVSQGCVKLWHCRAEGFFLQK